MLGRIVEEGQPGHVRLYGADSHGPLATLNARPWPEAPPRFVHQAL